MNVKLEAALAYARMRWRIFPCHSIVNCACSCGKPACASPGKHPRTRGGFKDATDDPEQIRKWWTRWPDANIALATGSGLAVIDIDGPAGATEFKALLGQHGRVPDTLTAATGRGAHLIFSTAEGSPEVRSSARGNVHVRGEGGYIIVAPSNHISGNDYKWLRKNPVAVLPEWLRQWSQGYEVSKEKARDQGFEALGALPSHLSNSQSKQSNVTEIASEALKSVWSPSEQARLTSALAAIPADRHDSWVAVGMALKDMDWQRPDGDTGFDLWVAWSETCPDKFALAVCESRWNSFKRSGVSVGTVYHLAKEAGWTGGAPEPQQPPKHLNGHAAPVTALPAAFLNPPAAIFFPDLDEKKRPRATRLNAKVAIEALGVGCRYDKFHNRLLVEGELVKQWNSRELSDPIIAMVRDRIRYKFGFDPGTQHTRDAAETLCYDHMFDPVLDYLDGLQWDGQPRLDCWLSTYLGVASSEYVRAISRLSLVAAVRRARHPGTKFDQIIVLEGKQGAGKSEAIRILAGPENFSDQKILGVDERKQQELTEGVWLYEIAELTGLRRADLDQVKAFVSRTADRARPAYGRYMVQQERRTLFFGSINPGHAYLQDDTGNRRFWPVAVGRIDLAGLRRDRDQIWAEASLAEGQGASHVMDEALWHAASEEQDKRTEVDEWTAPINDYLALKGLAEVSVMQVLADNQFLQLAAKDIGQYQQARAARVLRGLGFERYRENPDARGKRPWRYRRVSS